MASDNPTIKSPTTQAARKIYLGDGVYAEFDGYGIWLTTENGLSRDNTIYLEPEVYRALVSFVEGRAL